MRRKVISWDTPALTMLLLAICSKEIPMNSRAKSFDTFAPFGPWIASIDPSGVDIETRVNGETVQKSNTSDLIFGVPRLIEFISGIMTLQPGDVIATGTPPGVGQLHRGDDLVEVEIEG